MKQRFNRDIRFRAWDSSIGSWHPWDDEEALAFSMHHIGEESSYWTASIDLYDSIVVMQCTGAEDINGKEIYEGDVVYIHESPDQDEVGRYATVVWSDTFPGFSVEIRNGDDTLYANVMCTEDDHSYEIVGNLYDKPVKYENI